MCCITSDKAKYSVLIEDKTEHAICTIDFASASTLCRFLEDFDFEYGECSVFRKSDLQYFDPKFLLEIWRGK